MGQLYSKKEVDFFGVFKSPTTGHFEVFWSFNIKSFFQIFAFRLRFSKVLLYTFVRTIFNYDYLS